MHLESGFRFAAIGCKLKKWKWRHNFSTFTYWSKFHVNIITGSRVMKISFYKGLTRNPEIGNTQVWVLPSIWRLGWVRNTKFGRIVSNKILLNVPKCQVYSLYCFWVINGKTTRRVKLPSPPRLGLRLRILGN